MTTSIETNDSIDRLAGLNASDSTYATRHQREVGTGYFDSVTQTIQGGTSSTTALKGSTEEEQFYEKEKAA